MTDWTRLAAERVQDQCPQSKFPQLSVVFLLSISTRLATKLTFVINNVIVFAISHILSAIYLNSNQSSGCTSGCNEGIVLKINNFHWSYISERDGWSR